MSIRPHSMLWRRRYRRGWSVCAVVAALAVGCKPHEAAPKVDTITGVITQIDPVARRVTLEFQRQDSDSRGTLVAHVSADAKVFINGVASALDQLRVGETATGYGTREKQDGGTIITALEIHVQRNVIAPTNASTPPPSEETP